MPTSVHLPKPLLEAVDRRARRLKISRNRFIVQALQKELARETEWSPGFFEQFERIDKDDAVAIDEMLAAIRSNRTSKKPHRL